MAGESAFEKIHVDESSKADLGGVLEQLNLPPAVVEFVRKNQRTIYIVLSVIAIVVVVWSLYGSYHEKKIIESSSALSAANNLDGDEKLTSLQGVIDNFSGTDSAQWAKIEIARHYIDKKEFDIASQKYAEITTDISATSPLYPLVIYGIAQAEEGQKNYEKAVQQYTILKNTKGFENIGYTGVARILEIQGNIEGAIKEFEEYLGVLVGDNPNSQEKLFISAKISRLKASQ